MAVPSSRRIVVIAIISIAFACGEPLPPPAPPSKLTFLVQPATTVAGRPIGDSVGVGVTDAAGRLQPTPDVAVTVALVPGTMDDSLAGTRTARTLNGRATFADLRLAVAKRGYRLQATARGLAGSQSDSFDIVPGPPARLRFASLPANVANYARFYVRVDVLDSTGNSAARAGDTVRLALVADSGAGTLAGVTVAPAHAGVAVFTDLSINRTGVYHVVARAAGLDSAVSTSTVVTGVDPARLQIWAPTRFASGLDFYPAVQVRIVNVEGYPVWAANHTVTVTLSPATAGGAAVSGTRTVRAAGGTAVFTDLRLNRVGTGYRLVARAPASRATARRSRSSRPSRRAARKEPSARGAAPPARSPPMAPRTAGATTAWDNSATVLRWPCADRPA